MNLNENFSRIAESYLFAEVAKRASAFAFTHPDKKILNLGIGDVTLPLAPKVIKAMRTAVEEMADRRTFKGYAPYEGYGFLREAVSGYYSSLGVKISPDEIFVSDGAKSDLGNLLDLFSADNAVLVPDPVYPVYSDTNIMAGHRIIFADATEKNGFLPMPEENVEADLIYICSPNNPTGAAYSKEQIKKWVEYAQKIGAIIIYDAAYEAFISENGIVRSVFEVKEARSCAIEVCSLSKTAGFTGMRCGYTVICKDLQKNGYSLNKLWFRRQSAKFNGVSYIIQKAAAAVFTDEGQSEIKRSINCYKKNTEIIAGALDKVGIFYSGGKNSPYIWLKCPDNLKSWEFFDYLLNETQIVGTPGVGFGKNGENFFRLTAFGSADDTFEAADRITKLFKKI